MIPGATFLAELAGLAYRERQTAGRRRILLAGAAFLGLCTDWLGWLGWAGLAGLQRAANSGPEDSAPFGRGPAAVGPQPKKNQKDQEYQKVT